jgi:hypothetical protein
MWAIKLFSSPQPSFAESRRKSDSGSMVAASLLHSNNRSFVMVSTMPPRHVNASLVCDFL